MDHETNSGPFMRLRFLIVIPERQEPGGDKTTFVLKIIIGIREKERTDPIISSLCLIIISWLGAEPVASSNPGTFLIFIREE